MHGYVPANDQRDVAPCWSYATPTPAAVRAAGATALLQASRGCVVQEAWQAADMAGAGSISANPFSWPAAWCCPLAWLSASSWRHSCTRCLLHMPSCAHSKVARADQQGARHPHVIQASQRRPLRWQGASQLVVVEVPASRCTEQRAGVNKSRNRCMGTCPDNDQHVVPCWSYATPTPAAMRAAGSAVLLARAGVHVEKGHGWQLTWLRQAAELQTHSAGVWPGAVPSPAGLQLAPQLNNMPATHAKLCSQQGGTCTSAARRHPHVIQASQRRPHRWQVAGQLVLVQISSVNRGAQNTGWMSSMPKQTHGRVGQ
jgi:hypothetical protein